LQLSLLGQAVSILKPKREGSCCALQMMQMDESRQLIELAQQFFSIANAITAFTVIQAVALMYGFKDIKLVAAFLRWRPYTSILYRYASGGYIIAVVSCGITEFSLRYAASQRAAFLAACVIAVVLRCIAIHVTASVHSRIFVAICREQNWLNKNRKEHREFQTPRVLHKLSKSEERLYRLAIKADEKLFGAECLAVVQAEDFDEDPRRLTIKNE
jgi:hypothetical protein